MTQNPVITIDGASGTGKGVVTHRIAKELGWNLLDSGVLYRVLALDADRQGVSFENEALLSDLANHLDVKFVAHHSWDPPRVLLEGMDVSAIIRTEKVGNAASKIGALPGVRLALLDRQRAFRIPPGLVTDGRDMGTIVFPDADIKFFLTASPEKRALRRYNQLKEMNIHANLHDLVLELRERDSRDHGRIVAPLVPAADAICIDTDHLTVKQVVESVMAAVRRVFPAPDR